MARKKKSADEVNYFAELAEATGGEVVSDIQPVNYWIDTGNLAFNWICSGRFMHGGFPGGKIVEIYGPSASGKTLWGTNALRGCQAINGISAFLDCENSLNPEFAATASHVDTDRIVRHAPTHLEGAFLKIANIIGFVRSKVPLEVPLLTVYDGFSVSPPQSRYEELETKQPKKKDTFEEIVDVDVGKEQPAERARIISRELGRIFPKLGKSNSTLLILNQIRHKIGVLYGSPESRPGGNALEFYASCIVRTSVHKKIEDNLKNIIGVNLKAKNMKNRHFAPFKEVEGIKLFFEKGVDPLSGLLDALVKAKRLTGKAPNYIIEPEYTGGKEVKFRTSKESGMPVNLLVEYPDLIDANNGQEVLDYVQLFDGAIQQSHNEENVEKDVENQYFDDENESEDS